MRYGHLPPPPSRRKPGPQAIKDGTRRPRPRPSPGIRPRHVRERRGVHQAQRNAPFQEGREKGALPPSALMHPTLADRPLRHERAGVTPPKPPLPRERGLGVRGHYPVHARAVKPPPLIPGPSPKGEGGAPPKASRCCSRVRVTSGAVGRVPCAF